MTVLLLILLLITSVISGTVTQELYCIRTFAFASGVSSIFVDGVDVFATGGSATIIRQWKLNDTGYSADYETSGSPLNALVLSSSAKLYTGQYAIGIRSFDLRSSIPGTPVDFVSLDSNLFALATNDVYLFGGYSDGTVMRWQLSGDGPAASPVGYHSAYVADIVVNGDSLFSVGADGYCYQWAIQPVQTRKSVRSFSYNKIPFYAVASAGDFVFAGGQAPFAVYQWHISDGRLLNILNGHTASIQALAVSGDDFLFSGGNDQLIIQWRLTDGQQVRNITGHSGTVNALFVSNKTVFSGSADATVKQWYVPEPLISPSPTQSVVPTPRPLPPPPASNDLLIKILGSLFGAVAFLALVFFIAQYMYIKYLTKKADALAPKQLAFGQPQVKGPPDNGDFHEIRDTGGKRESQSILVATAAKQDGVISRPGMTLRGKDVQQSQDTVAGSNMALNV